MASTFSLEALSLTWLTPRARASARKAVPCSTLAAAVATQSEEELEPNAYGDGGAKSPIASTKVFANSAHSPPWHAQVGSDDFQVDLNGLKCAPCMKSCTPVAVSDFD